MPSVRVDLAPGFVRTAVRKRLADIHDGDFVASTSVRGKDGKLHATEVHIFMPAQRGVVPEGQFPWDLAPHSLMTNAIVSGIGTVKAGRILTVSYGGKSVDIEADRNTPIVAYWRRVGPTEHGRRRTSRSKARASSRRCSGDPGPIAR